MKHKLEITMIILVIIALSSLFVGYYLGGGSINHIEKKYVVNSEQDMVNNCKNLTIIDTSECLTNNIKMIYNYSYNIDSPRTFEQLKTIGGSCKDYASLLKDVGSQLGFYSDTFVIKTNSTFYHEFAVISNDESYCVLDQIIYECVNFKK